MLGCESCTCNAAWPYAAGGQAQALQPGVMHACCSQRHQRQSTGSRSAAHLLTLQQVGRHSTAGDSIIGLVLIVVLLVHGNGLPHAGLLCMPLLGIQLALEAQRLLRKRSALVHLPGLLFALALLKVEALPLALPVQVHVLPLRHGAALPGSGLKQAGAPDAALTSLSTRAMCRLRTCAWLGVVQQLSHQGHSETNLARRRSA